MQRTVAVVGAPSSIGIRPYDDGRLELTIYDPRLDPDSRGALRLGALLERIIGTGRPT